MLQWKRILLICCCLCATLVTQAAKLAGTFSDELDKDRYDCIVSLNPAKTLTKSSTARVTLEWDATKGSLQCAITRDTITVLSVQGAKKNVIGTIASGVVPGKPYNLTIMRRGGSLGLLLDTKLIMRANVPHAPGNAGGILVDKGWTIDETRVQPLEPVIFSDDFMRSANEPGPWKVQTGQWGLQTAWDATPHGNQKAFKNSQEGYAQNPFAWIGCNPKAGGALCTAGETFWEDYTMSMAIRPASDGAVGAMVNMPDQKSGILIRWTPVNATGDSGNKLTVYRVADGKNTVLASSPGGYLPGQWYRLSIISSLTGIRVLTDGKERAVVNDDLYWRGRVGLYAEGSNPCIFDDVSVTGTTLNTDLLLETKITQVNQRFLTDNNGMRVWSDTRSDWTAAEGIPNQYWYRRDLFGDHEWMVVSVRPTPLTSGELCLTLNGDGKKSTSGYRVLLKLTDNPVKLTYTLFHDEKQLATKSATPLPANVDYTLRFWRDGSKLLLEVDDEPVISVDDKTPPSGLRPSYRANGCFANTRNVIVLSHSILDYTFAEAPTDWLTAGTWMPTIRWSCSPNWSFLAGWSRGDTAMWHKDIFSGDQSFEAFIGIKMEYPRERQIYDDRYRDFCITICGNGHDVRSGYSGTFASGNGPTRQITLMRDGVVVASQSVPQSMIPNRGANHRSWFDLELQKTGASVTFQVKVNGQMLSVNYLDPNPIDKGIPAVWSTDNGISISRARISFSTPPTPRVDPQVVIDNPWYPEWGNQNRTMTLDFPESYATTGKTVQLSSTAKTVPAGDENAIKANGKQIAFTPTSTGDHLYSVIGTDGENRSEPFYITLPVFNPALGRDDSHALLLYRFTEGKGDVVNDMSAIGPKANLKIQPFDDRAWKLSADWQPTQGLTMHEGSKVATVDATGVDKLSAIAKNKAGSFEFWISTDTIYPPSPEQILNWTACIFSIDLAKSTNPSQRALAVTLSQTSLFVLPGAGPIRRDNNQQFAGFRTGLLHIVVTWDGTYTRTYVNGSQTGERRLAWPDSFAAGNSLILGNTADGNFPYLGTFYLFAIHDRCLNNDEIRRNYNAGPSAR